MANINSTLMRLGLPADVDGWDVTRDAVRLARRVWGGYRVANGWGTKAPLLTQPDGNSKFLKDQSVVTYGLALAQANTVGRVKVRLPDGTTIEVVINACPFSTPCCRAGCVAKGGMARFDGVLAARALKTRFLLEHPDARKAWDERDAEFKRLQDEALKRDPRYQEMLRAANENAPKLE